MRVTATHLIVGTIAIALLFTASGGGSYSSILQQFIPAVEGFSSRPVWDYKQWSWGYGTAAGFDRNVMPPGSITRDKAMQEAIAVNEKNWRTIRGRFNVSMKPYQIAAMLSLAYNLGPSRIDVFAPYVNAGDYNGLFAKMRAYVYAGGVRNQGLVNRREKEIALFEGNWHPASGRLAEEFAAEPVIFIAPELITDEYGN